MGLAPARHSGLPTAPRPLLPGFTLADRWACKVLLMLLGWHILERNAPAPAPCSITLVREFITDGFFSGHFRVPASSSQDQPRQTQVWPWQGTQTGADDNQHASKGNAEKAPGDLSRRAQAPQHPRLPIPATQHWLPGLQARGCLGQLAATAFCRSVTLGRGCTLTRLPRSPTLRFKDPAGPQRALPRRTQARVATGPT